jgi:hypothetical protein
VARQLCELIPLYDDVDVRPSQQGHHRLIFQDRWTPSLWYEPAQVSDGTMILLAFLVLTHTEEPPDILAVEEPEYALHPFQKNGRRRLPNTKSRWVSYGCRGHGRGAGRVRRSMRVGSAPRSFGVMTAS